MKICFKDPDKGVTLYYVDIDVDSHRLIVTENYYDGKYLDSGFFINSEFEFIKHHFSDDPLVKHIGKCY